jgi:hypothetical protein
MLISCVNYIILSVIPSFFEVKVRNHDYHFCGSHEFTHLATIDRLKELKESFIILTYPNSTHIPLYGGSLGGSSEDLTFYFLMS